MPDHDDPEGIPFRRRTNDMPAASWELVLYQLSELKADVREGFQRMDGRFDQAENRLTALERFRERQEERDRAAADASNLINSRWLPILFIAASTLVTIILFLVGK